MKPEELSKYRQVASHVVSTVLQVLEGSDAVSHGFSEFYWVPIAAKSLSFLPSALSDSAVS